ncbi:probable tRNA N6-adenosine threonylcarbamoyltransferase, mitochondrial isoform X1 [Octopus vulgaris]|uniref:N(6)-L-threonylcarbamoyladenine synthase n=1 Tax=Octopus vulgaris TaxID=6645 RepID=A0AA36B590_OCTVU|nr:probable tRNA N6-adenosine threonylcarbamoyltransferase, mitochondrial isoform X1 [Octopus vulgaris]
MAATICPMLHRVRCFLVYKQCLHLRYNIGRDYSCRSRSLYHNNPTISHYSSFRPFHPLGEYTGSKRLLVLGLETSCDDTGAAVVDNLGHVWGEALHSQTSTHIELGGIIPPIAQKLHQQHIAGVVEKAFEEANVTLEDVDAIAVTVKPGLSLSLAVGLQYAKELAKEYRKPIIPIHHMEAHALTVRMKQPVNFPFLVLLASGGHCLLAVSKSVNEFALLGTTMDNAPGDVFDKVARSLKLKNLPQCYGLSGGASVELVAKNGQPHAFEFPQVMLQSPDCNFSFSGFNSMAHRYISLAEKDQNIKGDAIISNAADLCASFQLGVLKHLAKRVQRALLFSEITGLLGKEKTLVVSGGVACNQFLINNLRKVCEEYNCSLYCPPPKLCTDNGIMVAWNGIEKLARGIGIAKDLEQIEIQAKSPLGENLTEEVSKVKLKLERLKFDV